MSKFDRPRTTVNVGALSPPSSEPESQTPMSEERLALLHGYARRENVVIAAMLREALSEIDRLRSALRSGGETL
jgi:hypothetical protein